MIVFGNLLSIFEHPWKPRSPSRGHAFTHSENTGTAGGKAFILRSKPMMWENRGKLTRRKDTTKSKCGVVDTGVQLEGDLERIAPLRQTTSRFVLTGTKLAGVPSQR